MINGGFASRENTRAKIVYLGIEAGKKYYIVYAGMEAGKKDCLYKGLRIV